MSSPNGLVQRLWSYCNVLRDDGLSYGDYLGQLTYLLFLKMADEQTRRRSRGRRSCLRVWTGRRCSSGTATNSRCITGMVLTELGRRPGMLGVVFRKAQNRIQDPA